MSDESELAPSREKIRADMAGEFGYVMFDTIGRRDAEIYASQEIHGEWYSSRDDAIASAIRYANMGYGCCAYKITPIIDIDLVHHEHHDVQVPAVATGSEVADPDLIKQIMLEVLAYGDGRANEIGEGECGSPVEAEKIRASADARYRTIRRALIALVAERDQGRAEVGQLAVNQKRVAASTYQAASGLHDRHIRCLAERDEARAELDEALVRLNAALVRVELMRPVVEAARGMRDAFRLPPDKVPGRWGEGVDQAEAVLHEALDALDAPRSTGRTDAREEDGRG